MVSAYGGPPIEALGAAPGSWSQVAAQKGAKVVSIDVLEMEPIPGVTVIQGNFLDPEVRDAVRRAAGDKADLVLSDMMPNVSGIASADQARACPRTRYRAYSYRSLSFSCRGLFGKPRLNKAARLA